MQREWFDNPNLGELSALTITDDGQVFGHIAGWGTCHIGQRGTCLTAPKSRSNYAYFRTGEIRFPDSAPIATGPITLNTGHAGMTLDARSAASHYDHTGTAVADVVAGEDAFGIWVAGAIRPGTSDDAIHTLRASAPSGDWRAIGRKLELVAVLAVNTPGFPVPRAIRAAGAPDDCDDCLMALIAAGSVNPSRHADGKFREGAVTSVRAGDVKPGDVINHPGMVGSRFKVSAVHPQEDGTVRISGSRVAADGHTSGEGESAVLGEALHQAGNVPAGKRVDKDKTMSLTAALEAYENTQAQSAREARLAELEQAFSALAGRVLTEESFGKRKKK